MHIAVVAPSLTGRLNSTFELVSRLESEGHDVTYLCSPKIAKKVEEQGFKYIMTPEINFDFVEAEFKKPSSWIDKARFHFTNFGKHYEHGKRLLHLDEYQNIISTLAPDRILVDVELHDFIFTAIGAKVPVLLYHTWFPDTFNINLPPIRTSIIPGIGFTGSKFGILMAWLKMRLMIYGRFYINIFTFKNYRREVFRKYAKEIGFSRSHMKLSTLPPLYRFTELPILTMVMAETDFPHSTAKNIKYIGPMVYESREEQKETPEDKRLGEILFRKKDKEKLLYCSVGSMAKGYLPFLKNVISAVSNLDEVLLILSIGPKMSKASFQDIPTNVFIFNWISQLKVLSKADCAIVPGGMNTINECIHYKVPMLLYSTRYTDQNGNVARMAYHGLGIRGDILNESVEQIRANILKILEEKEVQAKVLKMNAVYRKYRNRELTSFLN